MRTSIVVMGVAGCGKSSLGAALARATGGRLVEGDDFHSDENRERMRQGIALTDADRVHWLDALAAQLRANRHGAVLTCSALKAAFRDKLRAASPGLAFVHLQISPHDALQRVTSRANGHFFCASLVDSQFATLEPPFGEPRVLALDALLPLNESTAQAVRWQVEEIEARQGSDER
ncbi:MAG: gluconokinase [Rhodocyclaceae bacterium]|nr:gluconokinase [Rhodocyclaceae bacterium]